MIGLSTQHHLVNLAMGGTALGVIETIPPSPDNSDFYLKLATVLISGAIQIINAIHLRRQKRKETKTKSQ